jgi:subtilisin family serine protease
MRRIIYVFLSLILMSCGNEKVAGISIDPARETGVAKTTLQSILSGMERGRYKEGELLVKFKSGVISAASLRTHQAINARVLNRSLNLEHIKLPEDISVRDAVMRYMNDPDVEYAEPNYIRKVRVTPNDTYFSQQWGLQKISAHQAWDINTGSTVAVAVIDTGIYFNHPDLSANIWANAGESNCSDGIDNDLNGYIDDCRGWNFVANNNSPMDDEGHGTHVGGIIGAAGNNGIGVSGVAWNLKLMPLKILNSNGEGTVANELRAISYAVAKGAKVINASFSGSDFSNAEYDAIASANTAGVLVAAAAGNGGADSIGDNNDLAPEYPASYTLPNIISVAATDQNDLLAYFSNYGINSVDIAAPGLAIYSTYPPGGYVNSSGTSMSTPFVSGLSGLLYGYYTGFSYSQIRSTIFRYSDALPSLSGRVQTGARINAYKALSSLVTPSGLNAASISGSQINLSWTDSATGEDGYKIERRTGNGTYSQIATPSANATTYTDSSLTDGVAYTYRVRAYNTIPADSNYSNEASAATQLNPPAGLAATAISTSQINLSWTDNSQTEEGYKIERKSAGGEFVQIATVGPNATTYSNTGLAESTAYSYRVRAYNTAAGNSSYSNEASATTHTPTDGGSSSGGGGGCSIGARQNMPTTVADIAVLLLPAVIIALSRRRQ